MKDGKKFFVGGLLNLGAGLGTAAYGAYQERQAKKKMAQADAVAQGPIRSQAARQRIAQQESDSQAAVDSALRAQATAAEQIAQQGGSRGLVSATPGLIRATDIATQGALDTFGQKNAQARQLQESMNLRTQRAGATATMDRLAQAADAGRTATMQGVSQALSGVAEIAGAIGPKKKKTKDEDPFKIEDATSVIPDQGGGRSTVLDDNTIVTDYDGDATPFKPAGSIVENRTSTDAAVDQALRPRDQMIMFEDELEKAPLTQVDDSAVGLTIDEAQAANAFEQDVKDMRNIPFNPSSNRSILSTGFAEGGEVDEPVEKTPGKFSHKENPIDIIQEGAKIGEMTGGEYIFNPEQAEEMRKLSEEGDSELHQFIRNLLSKEQFQ